MADIYPSSSGFVTITTGTGTSTWGGYSPATTSPVVSAGTVNVYPAAPKKRTPLEWLEDEIERICALTRPGLVA